jgi:hypothetical protein
MFKVRRRLLVGGLISVIGSTFMITVAGAQGPAIKITDPTSVVMIVTRDSNDISFMDIQTKRWSGRCSWATTSILTW